MELIFFFFQAEDGIRDWSVTGVQTCALPIYGGGRKFGVSFRRGDVRRIFFHPRHLDGFGPGTSQCECSLVREAVEHAAPAGILRDCFIVLLLIEVKASLLPMQRSEERRVGKEWRSWGSRNE